jgi:uncharacterized membrane protein YphA (DoxX/SURF4 family)
MLANQDRVHSVQQILRVLFGIVPVVAGADKFFNLLTNWEQYVNPTLERLLPFSTTTFMHVAGVIEIVAGLVVLSRFTTFGAYLVSAWLALIAISLIASGHYLDVAVRDLVMSASAYSLATLSRVRQDQTSTNYKQVTARTITV